MHSAQKKKVTMFPFHRCARARVISAEMRPARAGCKRRREGGCLSVNDGVEGLFLGEKGAVHNCSVSCIRGMFCACHLSAVPRIFEAPEG